MNRNPITRTGYEVLTRELSEKSTMGRKCVAKDLELSRESGNLSENSEYMYAKERQAQLESRIAFLQNYLSKADIVEAQRSRDCISFGVPAKVMNLDTDEIKVFTIVGELESDAKKGKISYVSPLGRELLGKRVGEDIELVTPGGEQYWEVLSVSEDIS